MIGEQRKSYSGNRYHDFKIVTGEKESYNVRYMITKENDDLSTHYEKPVKLRNIARREGTIFLNEKFGGKVERLTYPLEFQNIVQTKNIIDIVENDAHVNVEGCIHWLGEEEVTKRGTTFRNAVIKDLSGEIELTVWRHMINELQEERWYKLTDLNVKMFLTF